VVVEEEVVVAAVAMTAEPAWWWLWWRVRGVAVVVACGGRWDRAWALKTHSKVFLFFLVLAFFCPELQKTHDKEVRRMRDKKRTTKSHLPCGLRHAHRQKTPDKRVCRAFFMPLPCATGAR
jgi:hypothetical protein